jgi:hypothetical protein
MRSGLGDDPSAPLVLACPRPTGGVVAYAETTSTPVPGATEWLSVGGGGIRSEFGVVAFQSIVVVGMAGWANMPGVKAMAAAMVLSLTIPVELLGWQTEDQYQII